MNDADAYMVQTVKQATFLKDGKKTGWELTVRYVWILLILYGVFVGVTMIIAQNTQPGSVSCASTGNGNVGPQKASQNTTKTTRNAGDNVDNSATEHTGDTGDTGACGWRARTYARA